MKANRQAKAGNLICQLNPLIRGWAQYHRHVVSKETFAAVDAAIFKLLWRWAKRRHPQKERPLGAGRNTSAPRGAGSWVFSGRGGRRARGRPAPSASSPPCACRSVGTSRCGRQANPYDPAWELLLRGTPRRDHEADPDRERRQRRRCGRHKAGAARSATRRSRPIVSGTSTTWSGARTAAATRADNQVLLHPNCHRQVHSQGLTVGKPCPARGNREA